MMSSFDAAVMHSFSVPSHGAGPGQVRSVAAAGWMPAAPQPMAAPTTQRNFLRMIDIDFRLLGESTAAVNAGSRRTAPSKRYAARCFPGVTKPRVAVEKTQVRAPLRPRRRAGDPVAPPERPSDEILSGHGFSAPTGGELIRRGAGFRLARE
jgi:hypothetical protein